jgi:putative ABC transport system permease protein
MNLLDSLRVALAAIAANTLRSVLTTLGIIIGVASVIIMVSVGSGARSEVDRQIANLGSNMLVVFPGSAMIGGRSAGSGTSIPLSEPDIISIRDKVPGVVAISGQLQGSAAVVRGNVNTVTRIWGVHEGYLTARDWPLSEGREFTTQDLRTGARIAHVGTTVIKTLFQGDNPIGETIRIKGVPFLVVGVLVTKGQNTFGSDQDDVIMLPISAARGRIIGRSSVINDQVGQISVKFDDESNLVEAQEEIERVLRQRRKILPGTEDNFSVRNLAEFMRARTAAMTTMSLLLGATSAIALIVGGIGIMNIMLVSVTERTREIGLRMAVGARRRDIMLQFLTEATTLCILGGIFGVTLGVIGAVTVSSLGGWPVVISPLVVLLALGAAGATGIFFGFFPARRAAMLNPIDALRSE